MQHKDIAVKTTLLLLAVGVNALEYLFPKIPFLPWLKPGFSNAITIVWLIRFGTIDAVFYTIVRSWITSFYFGFSLITLALSLSGGIIATLGMGILFTLFGKQRLLGCIGLGIAGAALHNAGQLCAVFFLLTSTTSLLYQTPFMFLASLLFGTLTGLLAFAIFPLIFHSYQNDIELQFPLTGTSNRSPSRLITGIVILCLSIGLGFISQPLILAASSLSAISIAFFSSKASLKAVYMPIKRSWILFVFIAIMNIFFSYGKAVSGIPFLTQEGLHETLIEWLRLLAWIELSVILTALDFNRIALAQIFRRSSFGKETLAASLYALELFPAFVDLLQKHARIDIKKNWKHPVKNAKDLIVTLYADICQLTGTSQ
jgi:heptaprenyl diphosphate synthase